MKNISDHLVEERLLTELRQLIEFARSSRVLQSVGGVAITGLLTVTFPNMGAGATWILGATATVAENYLTIWDPFWTIDANNAGSGAGYKYWPNQLDDSGHYIGAVVSQNFQPDWARSNDDTGTRQYYWVIKNNDTHALDLRMRLKGYALRLRTATVSA